jgi:hypothetical protein
MIAGHETTATSLSWIFLELTRKPEIQVKLRNEIRLQELKIQGRGETNFTWKDYEDMPYLTAVIKVNFYDTAQMEALMSSHQESLRYYPAAFNTGRQALEDDVLPLSQPIRTANGEFLTELPIPKGIDISIPIFTYNRYVPTASIRLSQADISAIQTGAHIWKRRRCLQS